MFCGGAGFVCARPCSGTLGASSARHHGRAHPGLGDDLVRAVHSPVGIMAKTAITAQSQWGETLRRFMAKAVLGTVTKDMSRYFHPSLLGFGTGSGCEDIVPSIRRRQDRQVLLPARSSIESHPDRPGTAACATRTTASSCSAQRTFSPKGEFNKGTLLGPCSWLLPSNGTICASHKAAQVFLKAFTKGLDDRSL